MIVKVSDALFEQVLQNFGFELDEIFLLMVSEEWFEANFVCPILKKFYNDYRKYSYLARESLNKIDRKLYRLLAELNEFLIKQQIHLIFKDIPDEHTKLSKSL